MADKEPTEPTPEELAKLKLVEGTPVFASAFHMQSTGNEFTIMFQRPRALINEQGGIQGYARNEVVSIVTMSPQGLKDLSLVIANQLQQFEKDFGEIETIYTRRQKQGKP